MVRNLQILAESSQQLSEQTKQAQPDIDWYKISGFRNILVHNYLGIDMKTIWNIVGKEIPILKKAINSMLG